MPQVGANDARTPGPCRWGDCFMVSRVQVAAFKSAGFLHRKSLQYHWRNRDRKTDGGSTINNGNMNGASIATATDSAVVLEATRMTPSEEAQRVVNAAREGDNGSSTKYVDFDCYLGNFASKRRIKVCFRSTKWRVLSALVAVGCCPNRLVSLGG